MFYLNQKLSAAMWGRVQLLWLLLAITAASLGGGAAYMGNFVQGNVEEELTSQQIYFTPLDAMSEHELAIDGARENAGKQVVNGDQARTYSDIIALHMSEGAIEAGFPADSSYASLGAAQRELRAEVATAEQAGDQAAVDEAQAKFDEVTQLRNTMMNGSNLRGQLLNSYGWDTFGLGVALAGYGLIVLAVIFFFLFLFERMRGHLPATTPNRNDGRATT